MITRRARFRFFRALGDEARDLLLLALADAAALDGASPLTVWAGAGGEVVRTLMAGADEEAAAAAAPAAAPGRGRDGGVRRARRAPRSAACWRWPGRPRRSGCAHA